MITKPQLTAIMPSLKKNQARLDAYFPYLVAAMVEAEITTPQRQAAFLAQIGHESYDLRYMAEVWGPTTQQLKYEPPSTVATHLGNTQEGDGFRYRGAGPIQVTGRANFRAAGKALGLDLEGSPEQAFTPAVGFRLAAWFWTTRNLNALADQLSLDPQADAKVFDRITLKINGGYNGKDLRDRRYANACAVLA